MLIARTGDLLTMLSIFLTIDHTWLLFATNCIRSEIHIALYIEPWYINNKTTTPGVHYIYIYIFIYILRKTTYMEWVNPFTRLPRLASNAKRPIHICQETQPVPIHVRQENPPVPIHVRQETPPVPIHVRQETPPVLQQVWRTSSVTSGQIIRTPLTLTDCVRKQNVDI